MVQNGLSHFDFFQNTCLKKESGVGVPVPQFLPHINLEWGTTYLNMRHLIDGSNKIVDNEYKHIEQSVQLVTAAR